MSLKNTVAVERRMDLASLFCMIGRHGPAVALAVIAMVSVLAGFIIYRNVRGKRRKAAAEAEADDCKCQGAERDASVIQPSPEESHRSAESTDVSDEGPSDMRGDVHHSDLKVRHRRAAAAAAAAAAEKTPSPSPPPNSDIQAPGNTHTTSDDTEQTTVEWDSSKVAEMCEEEANQLLSSVAELEVEDSVDCHQGATADTSEDAIEAVPVNDSCLKEPEQINDENHEEEEMVLQAECQKDEYVAQDMDVSDKKMRPEEENFEFALNSPACFKQTPQMDENGNNDRLQDDKTTLETNNKSNSEEPVNQIEDVTAPGVCYDKDAECKNENLDSIDYSSSSGNKDLSSEAEKENDSSEIAEEECVDFQVIAQQAEIRPLTCEQDINLQSSQQEQCDRVAGTVMPPFGDGSCDGNDGLAREVIEDVVGEDLPSKLTADKLDTHSPQFEQEAETEQKGENDLTCNQEDAILCDGTDQVNEEMLCSDNIVACIEESQSLSVAPPCLIDVRDDSLTGITTDAKAQISDTEDFYDLSLDYHLLKEDQIAPSLDGDTEAVVISPQMQSHETENLPESSRDDITVVLAKEISDQVNDQHVESGYKDQQSVQMTNIEVSDIVSVAVDPDTVQNATASVIVEEISCPHPPPICQDQQIDHMPLPCLSETVKADKCDNDLSGITTDAKAQISDIADFPDLSVGCHPQKEDKIALSLDEDTDSAVTLPQMVSEETENLPKNNTNDRTVVLAEESDDQVCDQHVQSCFQDRQNVQMILEVSDKEIIAVGPDAVQKATASAEVEEIPCPQLPPICQDQQSERVEKDGTLDVKRVDFVTDADSCNNASLSVLVVYEENSHPDMLTSSQDQQSGHVENIDFSENTTVTAPDMTKDINRLMCQIDLPSFEQSEHRIDDESSPSNGEESGISSMVVSPDLQDAGNEFDVTIGNMVLSAREHDLQSEGQTEAHHRLFADDVGISVINKGTAGMVFGHYPSSCSKAPQSEHIDWIKYESFAANEDVFGHEIEDAYHKAIEQFAAQVAASITSHTDDLKIQTDIKAVVEDAEIKEKAIVNVEKKEDTKEEDKKEDDCDKTEISIMEATMDNNEWITDSNYQVPPWLNFSAPSFVQDHTKASQLPTDESQCTSAGTGAACIDITDVPPSPEVSPTSPTSLVDEIMENNKKVLAVQPMPQNVNVTFRIHYFTQSPYQMVAVTGNQEELGNWKGFIPLERAKDGHWATVVSLPVESHIEWKFVVVDKGEVCRWEECGNRLLDTGYGDDLLVHKWWGLL